MTYEQIIQYRVRIDGAMFRMKAADGTWRYLAPPVIKDGKTETWSRFAGQYDINKVPLFEGDIVECDVLFKEFGSRIKSFAVVVWAPHSSMFYYEIIGPAPEVAFFDIQYPKKVGDIWTNPEIMKTKIA